LDEQKEDVRHQGTIVLVIIFYAATDPANDQWIGAKK
jgi:hypothetical protein